MAGTGYSFAKTCDGCIAINMNEMEASGRFVEKPRGRLTSPAYLSVCLSVEGTPTFLQHWFILYCAALR